MIHPIVVAGKYLELLKNNCADILFPEGLRQYAVALGLNLTECPIAAASNYCDALNNLVVVIIERGLLGLLLLLVFQLIHSTPPNR